MSLKKTIRIFEWWEFKLSPLLAIFYATAIFTATPLLSIWQLPLLLLLSLTVGAVYVSVINDLTDIETDRLAGKPNRFADKSLFFKIFSLSACFSAGIVIAYFWSNLSWLAGGFYIAAWVAYALYSIYPFRLKNRGFPGVLSDAFGAHFFPNLFVVSATFAWVGQPVNFIWLVLIGIWAAACGIRGILLHQVLDYKSDLNSKVKTFVTKHSKWLACWLGERIMFPIEITALIGIIIYSQNLIALFLLIVYVFFVWSKSVVWEDLSFVIVAPIRNYYVLMNDYYSALFPLAFLLSAALINPADIIFGVIHFALFPKHLLSIAKEIFLVAGEVITQNKNRSTPSE